MNGRLTTLPSLCWLCLAAFLILASRGLADDRADRRGIQFFEAKIRPVLIDHCYKCHSAESDELGGKLRVDLREGLLQGGDSGPALTPGKPNESLLISAMEYQDYEMPPAGKLSDDIIKDFKTWIRMGAPDPRNGQMSAPAEVAPAAVADKLWSLQPVQNPPTPELADPAWSWQPLDRFIAAARESQQLRPVSDASPETLLRRVTFDLTGLPPTPEAIRQFRDDPTDAAFARVVDDLLGSPQFGERWARHWFDAVRYGESAGSSRDVLMIYAWRYRDYVIDALNADVPYDRFLTEQLAGDLLPAKTPDERSRLQVATGLLAIGSKSLNGGNVDLDLVDDQIDVVGKAIAGLTISCARCHDHKFDPIPTADYYALAGIFRSTDTFFGGDTRRPKSTSDKLKVYIPIGTDADERAARIVEAERKISALTKTRTNVVNAARKQQGQLPKNWEATRDALIAKQAAATEEATGPVLTEEEMSLLTKVENFEATLEKQRDIERQLKSLQADERDLPVPEFALGTRDARKIANFPIQIRGERNKAGDIVPRGFLSCIKTIDAEFSIPGESSGRLELAQWLTHPDHPLTARVAVNRVWQHLFGRGLVETVDNFGVNGTRPSHPDLLDYLAYRFVHEHHWSVKSLIRELVLSHTYQMSSRFDAANSEIDPDNKIYWRMSRRRLEAECLRDAMLAASGELTLERPYGSAVLEIGEGEVGRGIDTKPLEKPFPHRSVYLPIIRGIIPEVLRVFDFPEPSNPQGLRDITNVPAQSLYLMNSPRVIAMSESLARILLAESDEDAARIELAYLRVFGRSPSPDEITRLMAFLSQSNTKLSRDIEDESIRVLTSWTSLSQALFASGEFRYLD